MVSSCVLYFLPMTPHTHTRTHTPRQLPRDHFGLGYIIRVATDGPNRLHLECEMTTFPQFHPRLRLKTPRILS
jgi:hypothetical protein